MDNTIRIEEIINEIHSKIQNDFSTLNCLTQGGCGVFAYLFGKRLKELGIPFKLRELDKYDTSDELQNSDTNEIFHPSDPYHSCNNFFNRVTTLDKKTERIYPEKENEISWYHIEVELDTDKNSYLIDGDGIRIIKETEVGTILQEQDMFAELLGVNTKVILGAEVDFDTLGKVLDYDIWSDKFDKKQIPTLEKIIETELV